MESKKVDHILVRPVDPTSTSFAGIPLLETMAYLLALAGCTEPETCLNGYSTKELLQKVYQKKQDYAENIILGKKLVQSGVISKEQLLEAIEYHINMSMPLQAALTNLKLCQPDQIQQVLGH